MDLDFAMAASGVGSAVRPPADAGEPHIVMRCQDGEEHCFTVAREETNLPWAYSFRNWQPARPVDVCGRWKVS